MQDIVPELIESIRNDFETNKKQIKKKERSTFKDVHDYATKLGEALSASFQKNITEKVLPEGVMYFNIAERAIRPFLEEIYKEVLQEAATVQKKLNSKVGIGMTPIIPEIDEDRIKGIIDKLSNGELY